MKHVNKTFYVKAVFFIALINIMFFSAQLNAKPTFNWIPKKLNIEQMQGKQFTHAIKVKVSKDIEGVAARVTPELSNWITVSPYFVGDLKKGQVIDLNIIIAIPYNAPLETVGGVIQLREAVLGKPFKTLAKPLPVTIRVIEGKNEGLPPDPGEDGNLTLLGVDIDDNGVRDDVQIAIANSYPDNKNVKFALMELAKSIQNSFIGYKLNDINVINDSLIQISTCVDRICALSDDPEGDMAFLDMITLNTSERHKANAFVEEKSVGQIFPGNYDPNEEIGE